MLMSSVFKKKKDIANNILTLLHSERPKLYGVLAILSEIGLKQIYKTKSKARFHHALVNLSYNCDVKSGLNFVTMIYGQQCLQIFLSPVSHSKEKCEKISK